MSSIVLALPHDSGIAPRFLAVAMLLGAALLGAGALMHPVLTGDAAHDLALMASTPGWRAMHLTMLLGSALVIAGIWVRVAGEPSPAQGGTLVAALAVISVGLALNALNIAYMAGSGTHLADMYRAGRADAAPLFEVTHPIGLMSARFGNALVALGALALGWAERASRATPPWVAWLAWTAAAGGLVGVFFFDETSRAILAAVSLLSGWEVATAVGVLRGRTAA